METGVVIPEPVSPTKNESANEHLLSNQVGEIVKNDNCEGPPGITDHSIKAHQPKQVHEESNTSGDSNCATADGEEFSGSADSADIANGSASRESEGAENISVVENSGFVKGKASETEKMDGNSDVAFDKQGPDFIETTSIHVEETAVQEPGVELEAMKNTNYEKRISEEESEDAKTEDEIVGKTEEVQAKSTMTEKHGSTEKQTIEVEYEEASPGYVEEEIPESAKWMADPPPVQAEKEMVKSSEEVGTTENSDQVQEKLQTGSTHKSPEEHVLEEKMPKDKTIANETEAGNTTAVEEKVSKDTETDKNNAQRSGISFKEVDQAENTRETEDDKVKVDESFDEEREGSREVVNDAIEKVGSGTQDDVLNRSKEPIDLTTSRSPLEEETQLGKRGEETEGTSQQALSKAAESRVDTPTETGIETAKESHGESNENIGEENKNQMRYKEDERTEEDTETKLDIEEEKEEEETETIKTVTLPVEATKEVKDDDVDNIKEQIIEKDATNDETNDEVKLCDQVIVQTKESGERIEPYSLEIKDLTQGREESFAENSKEKIQYEEYPKKPESLLDVPTEESQEMLTQMGQEAQDSCDRSHALTDIEFVVQTGEREAQIHDQYQKMPQEVESETPNEVNFEEQIQISSALPSMEQEQGTPAGVKKIQDKKSKEVKVEEDKSCSSPETTEIPKSDQTPSSEMVSKAQEEVAPEEVEQNQKMGQKEIEELKLEEIQTGNKQAPALAYEEEEQVHTSNAMKEEQDKDYNSPETEEMICPQEDQPRDLGLSESDTTSNVQAPSLKQLQISSSEESKMKTATTFETIEDEQEESKDEPQELENLGVGKDSTTGQSLPSKESSMPDEQIEEAHSQSEQSKEIKTPDEQIQISYATVQLNEQANLTSTEIGKKQTKNPEEKNQMLEGSDAATLTEKPVYHIHQEDQLDEQVKAPSSSLSSEKLVWTPIEATEKEKEETNEETIVAETLEGSGTTETSINVCHKQEDLKDLEAPKQHENIGDQPPAVGENLDNAAFLEKIEQMEHETNHSLYLPEAETEKELKGMSGNEKETKHDVSSGETKITEIGMQIEKATEAGAKVESNKKDFESSIKPKDTEIKEKHLSIETTELNTVGRQDKEEVDETTLKEIKEEIGLQQEHSRETEIVQAENTAACQPIQEEELSLPTEHVEEVRIQEEQITEIIARTEEEPTREIVDNKEDIAAYQALSEESPSEKIQLPSSTLSSKELVHAIPTEKQEGKTKESLLCDETIEECRPQKMRELIADQNLPEEDEQILTQSSESSLKGQDQEAQVEVMEAREDGKREREVNETEAQQDANASTCQPEEQTSDVETSKKVTDNSDQSIKSQRNSESPQTIHTTLSSQGMGQKIDNPGHVEEDPSLDIKERMNNEESSALTSEDNKPENTNRARENKEEGKAELENIKKKSSLEISDATLTKPKIQSNEASPKDNLLEAQEQVRGPVVAPENVAETQAPGMTEGNEMLQKGVTGEEKKKKNEDAPEASNQLTDAAASVLKETPNEELSGNDKIPEEKRMEGPTDIKKEEQETVKSQKEGCSSQQSEIAQEVQQFEKTITVTSYKQIPAEETQPQENIAKELQKNEGETKGAIDVEGSFSDSNNAEQVKKVVDLEEEYTSKESARSSLSDLLQKVKKDTSPTEQHEKDDMEKKTSREEKKDGEEHKDEETENTLIEEANTEEEKNKEDHKDEKEYKTSPDSIVTVEARDTIIKTPQKKSHNILSGVGSKVKHSISKVKKAITGKSSHAKTV